MQHKLVHNSCLNLFFGKIDMSPHKDLKITIDVGSMVGSDVELPPVSLHCLLIPEVTFCVLVPGTLSSGGKNYNHTHACRLNYGRIL